MTSETNFFICLSSKLFCESMNLFCIEPWSHPGGAYMGPFALGDELLCWPLMPPESFCKVVLSLFKVLSSLFRMRVVPYVPEVPALFCPPVWFSLSISCCS